MKTIGNTKNGNILVEITSEEHKTLLNLESVVHSRLHIGDRQLGLAGKNLSKVFVAITHFVKARYMVQQIEELSRNFKELLDGEV